MKMSPNAVEAAARAIDPAAFDLGATLHDPFGHEEPEMRLGRQSAARGTAMQILEAVAPLIAKQALRQLLASEGGAMTGDEKTPGGEDEQPLGSGADVIGGFPTAADWEAGYRDLHKHLQAMHQALLAIWHVAEPGDTEYMTFREPDDVLASVRTILAEQSATIERTAVLASDLQALLTHERVGRSVDDRVSEIISALGSQSTDADVANRGQRMTFADAFAAHEYDEEQDRLAAD